MKTIEDVIQAYKDYQMETPVDSYEEFLNYLGSNQNYIHDQYKILRSEIWEDIRDHIEVKIRNLLVFIFYTEEENYYPRDIKILRECKSFVKKYKKYQNKIKRLATEENYKELAKFTQFVDDYCNNYIDFYDCQRDNLDHSYSYFSCITPLPEDNREVESAFIEEKLDTFQTEKAVEKAKKM